MDCKPVSNKPGASKGDSTFDDRLQRKMEGSDGATPFSTDPSRSATEMSSSNTPAFTHQSQGSDEASQAEEATVGATPKPVQQQHTSGESPDESENVPAAEFPTSSITSTGHQQAHAHQQGHINRASFLPAVLRRSTGQHSQADRKSVV